jgi:hypothetical protein
MKTRPIVLAGMSAVAIATANVSPAQAVPMETHASHCNLSANWRVNVSATWYDGTEVINYVVLTSPGALDQTWTIWTALGNPRGTSGGISRVGKKTNPYTYRGNVRVEAQTITVDIFGGSGNCTATAAL